MTKMKDEKKWWKSKAVWAGIITALIGTYESIKTWMAPQFGWHLPEIPPVVYSGLGALGVYSRVKASKKIGK